MVEITYEEIKDIRLMLDHISKDYLRLSKDMKILSDTLRPIMVKLQIQEEANVEHE